MMKYIFLLTALLALPSLAWADNDYASLQKQIDQQQRKIQFLESSLERMRDALLQEHDERVASLHPVIQQPIESPQETASQAWDRIHAQSQLNEAVIQSENNSAEIYRMEHGY